MNPHIWVVIREYINAEIQLGIARHLKVVHGALLPASEISNLEEQSTRMETEIRRMIDALPAPQPALSPEQIMAINMQIPLGPRV